MSNTIIQAGFRYGFDSFQLLLLYCIHHVTTKYKENIRCFEHPSWFSEWIQPSNAILGADIQQIYNRVCST